MWCWPTPINKYLSLKGQNIWELSLEVGFYPVDTLKKVKVSLKVVLDNALKRLACLLKELRFVLINLSWHGKVSLQQKDISRLLGLLFSSLPSVLTFKSKYNHKKCRSIFGKTLITIKTKKYMILLKKQDMPKAIWSIFKFIDNINDYV